MWAPAKASIPKDGWLSLLHTGYRCIQYCIKYVKEYGKRRKIQLFISRDFITLVFSIERFLYKWNLACHMCREKKPEKYFEHIKYFKFNIISTCKWTKFLTDFLKNSVNRRVYYIKGKIQVFLVAKILCRNLYPVFFF